MGNLPTKQELEKFTEMLAENRELPEFFFEDMILKAPSSNVMNKLASSVLALYSYDDNPEDQSAAKEMQNAISIIARIIITSYSIHYTKLYEAASAAFVIPFLRAIAVPSV